MKLAKEEYTAIKKKKKEGRKEGRKKKGLKEKWKSYQE